MSKELLTLIGAQFHIEDFAPGKDYGKIVNICLPLSPENWCAIAMREGDSYVGGCCGNTSAIQDDVNSIFREGGWIRANDFREFVEQCSTHEGFEGFEDFGDPETWTKVIAMGEEERKKHPELETFDPKVFRTMTLPDIAKWVKNYWPWVDPWKKIELTWHCAKNLLAEDRRASDMLRPRNPTDVREAVFGLSRSMSVLSWEHLLENGGASLTFQKKATRTKLLYLTWPHLKLLHDKIQDLGWGPVRGFALVEKATQEVCRNGLGDCVYETPKEAEEVLALWIAEDSEEKRRRVARDGEPQLPVAERVVIQGVEISLEKGLVLDSNAVR